MKSGEINNIYEKYYNELFLYALSLCRDEELAKDLVSETFFKVLLSSNHPSQEEHSFKYWLFRVLKNHYIDQLRKDKASLDLEKVKPFISSPSKTEPANHYIENERNRRLYQHLMKLEPIIYREVIYMYYYAEMSIREVSVHINRTETNTKTILYRARKKLGKILKEDSYGF